MVPFDALIFTPKHYSYNFCPRTNFNDAVAEIFSMTTFPGRSDTEFQESSRVNFRKFRILVKLSQQEQLQCYQARTMQRSSKQRTFNGELTGGESYRNYPNDRHSRLWICGERKDEFPSLVMFLRWQCVPHQLVCLSFFMFDLSTNKAAHFL